MNAHTALTSVEPEILRLYRAMPDDVRHKVLQLLIREFPYADDEADQFLASAASEIYPVEPGTDEYQAEMLRDRLYCAYAGQPTSFASRQARIGLERDVVDAERRVNGRAAMMTALADPAWHGGKFGG